jgi:hypothetical protein
MFYKVIHVYAQGRGPHPSTITRYRTGGGMPSTFLSRRYSVNICSGVLALSQKRSIQISRRTRALFFLKSLQSRRCFTRLFFGLGCDSDSSTSGQCYTRGNCSGRSRLHRELHFIHHCIAENGFERRVGSISTVSNAHEARLWSKANRVEQNPTPPRRTSI